MATVADADHAHETAGQAKFPCRLQSDTFRNARGQEGAAKTLTNFPERQRTRL